MLQLWLKKINFVEEFNNFRKKELEKIFKLFNPIISSYMKQNSVNILIDAKNIFMGKVSTDLTKNVLVEIDRELN